MKVTWIMTIGSQIDRRFDPLPPERFAAFHREFQGDTWGICGRCGGACEINKIGSLMPGEAEYIAAARGESAADFGEKYLDGIITPYGVIDVLKLKPGCPFLSCDFRCTIKDVKVVLCDVYPIVFDVVDDRAEFSLDDWCPIVRLVPGLARIFETKGIPAIRHIDAPADWYRAVALYDSLRVDYNKLFAPRSSNLGYALLTLDQIRQCQADDAPPPGLKPAGGEHSDAPRTRSALQ